MRKYFPFKIVFFSVLASFILFYNPVFAENGKIDPVFKDAVIDGREYRKETLRFDFAKIVFTTDVSGVHFYISDHERKQIKEAYTEDIQNLDSLDFWNPAYMEMQYPWFSEFLYREEGLPAVIALSKWRKDKKIMVSTGFPNDLVPFKTPRWKGKMLHQYDEWPAVTYDQENGSIANFITGYITPDKSDQSMPDAHLASTKSFISELSEETGLSLEYISHEAETTQNYADIRIVFTDKKAVQEENSVHISYQSSFKPDTYLFRQDIEGRFPGRTFFAKRDGFRGYYLRDVNANIAFSICYIWRGYPGQELQGRINECLLRSMGLPAANYSNRNSLLGYSDKNMSELTEYDRYMLRALYSPYFESGMTINEFKSLVQ